MRCVAILAAAAATPALAQDAGEQVAVVSNVWAEAPLALLIVSQIKK